MRVRGSHAHRSRKCKLTLNEMHDAGYIAGERAFFVIASLMIHLCVTLSQDVRTSTGYTATISAHEMGHSLSMIHDNVYPTGQCSCTDPVGQCIMYATAS